MTTEEIIQRIQSMYSKGVQSKDSRLSPRHIYNKLVTTRSTLLRQQVNKGQQISEWSYQFLPCVELIKAPLHECPCVPDTGCYILRSKYKLPRPVQALDKMMIRGVTSLDGSINFDKTKFESVKNAAGNRFTSNKPKFYIKNEYLYVTVLKNLRAVTPFGLFDDPIAAKQFPSICVDECSECACKDPMEEEFPIDGNLIDPLIQMAADELINVFKQMGEDRESNATDDAFAKGAMIHKPPQQEV